MKAIEVKCPKCFAPPGEPCAKIGMPLILDPQSAGLDEVHFDRSVERVVQEKNLMPENCVMCKQPIGPWRHGSDYCSPRCWERHHGAELDHVDGDREPEELE